MQSTSASGHVDLLEMGGRLGAEERLVRETVHQFVEREVTPNIAAWYERGGFPTELIPELGSLGLLGMHLDGYGAAGASALMYGLACLELEAGDSALRSFVSVQGSLAMRAIHAFGSEDQKQRWLPEMAAGRAVGCFGLTEPDVGSNPAAMKTRARRDGPDWILNGTKMWITNGGFADVAVVWARDDEGAVRGFVVPRETSGFSTQDIHGKLSLRASLTSELILDDCRLPADALLPEVRGLRAPLSCLDEARFGVAWGAVGAARTCLEAALEYAGAREQFGKPIAGFQLTQEKLVTMVGEVSAATLLAHRLAELKDAGQLTSEQTSLGKLRNVESAVHVARLARTVLGANGITLEYPVMRHMANLESVATYEGTREIHMLVIGAHLTGHRAFN